MQLETKKSPRDMDFKKKTTFGETSKESQNLGSVHPSIEITKCISFQKFRYDKRKGTKYQDKDFMELRLTNLNGMVVRIIIMCIDARDCNIYLMHPNGLMGKYCHDGIYDKEYVIQEVDAKIRIPYIRVDRFKTRGSKFDNVQKVLEKRAEYLPSHYKERCLSHCQNEGTLVHMMNTTDVRFGVIASCHIADFKVPTYAISHVVGDANEKTTLGILKLSQHLIPTSGSVIDIFTTVEGPKVEGETFSVYITCEHDTDCHWESDITTVSAEDILYDKIITYQVPPLAPCLNTTSPINAVLKLECQERNQYCSYNFIYNPCDKAVVSKAGERKRTLPGLHIETSPIKSKLKKRKVSNMTSELDLGEQNHNDVNFFARESTVRESSVNVDLSTKQTEVYNATGSNQSSFHTEGKNNQENNSYLWENHQVNLRAHSRKVIPASVDTVSKVVKVNTSPTEMPDGQDLMDQDTHQISNLVQFLGEPIIESFKLTKAPQETKLSTSISGQNNTHLRSTHQPAISERHIFTGNVIEGTRVEVQGADSNLRPVFSISQTSHPVLSPCRAPTLYDIKFCHATPSTWQSTSPWEVTHREENLAVQLFSANSIPAREENFAANEGPVRNIQQAVTNKSSIKRSPESRTKAVEHRSSPPAAKMDISNFLNEEETNRFVQLTTDEFVETVMDLQNCPLLSLNSESFPSGG